MFVCWPTPAWVQAQSGQACDSRTEVHVEKRRRTSPGQVSHSNYIHERYVSGWLRLYDKAEPPTERMSRVVTAVTVCENTDRKLWNHAFDVKMSSVVNFDL